MATKKKKATPKGRKSAQEIAATKKKTSKIISDTNKKTSSIVSSTKKANKKISSDYTKGSAYQNAKKSQTMTIADIAKKYGFDFSKGYADSQAETIAQGQRNVYNSQQRTNESANQIANERIRNNYDSAAGDLDKGYFQQFLGTQQNQADRGLNAGIAANQNLQLAMNKQGEVADLWKQRNTNEQEESMRYANTNQTIAEALAQVEKERGMNSKNIYQDLITQGYGILNSDRTAATSWANSEFDRSQSLISNNMSYANMDLDNINNNANRNLSTTLDLSKMTLTDIYDEYDRAEAAAARAAAARASRPSYSTQGSPQKTVLTPNKNNFDKTLQSQSKTPIQSYRDKMLYPNNSPRKVNQRLMPAPSVRDNPNLTAWDKYKMLF